MILAITPFINFALGLIGLIHYKKVMSQIQAELLKEEEASSPVKVQFKELSLPLSIVLIVLCMLFSGCDALYRMIDKKGAEEKELVGEIVPYEMNAAVEEIQTLLKIYGYDPGSIDGKLGTKTRNALARFQKDYGLEVSRVADKQTWEKLSVFKSNGLIEEGDLNIKLIQEILKKAGFDSGKIDGKWGVKTKNAIVKFQEMHKLKVDGKVGYQTLSKLAEVLKDVKEGAIIEE